MITIKFHWKEIATALDGPLILVFMNITYVGGDKVKGHVTCLATCKTEEYAELLVAALDGHKETLTSDDLRKVICAESGRNP